MTITAIKTDEVQRTLSDLSFRETRWFGVLLCWGDTLGHRLMTDDPYTVDEHEGSKCKLSESASRHHVRPSLRLLSSSDQSQHYDHSNPDRLLVLFAKKSVSTPKFCKIER